MSQFTFQRAVKRQEKLRMALDGPPGSGKTWTSLEIGCWLALKEGGRVAVIDSERSSARKYAGGKNGFDFDHLTLPDFGPRTYTEAIKAASAAGYAVIVIDSLSHAWEGTLDMKDAVSKRSKSNDSFGAWREVTPVHNELVDVMLRSPAHVIATMRTKMEYLVEKNESTGRNTVSKIGLKPVQRDGVDYEFDVVGDMDQENTLTVTKSRCFELAGAVIRRPNSELAVALWEWLQDGEPLVTDEQAHQLRAALNAIPDDEQKVKAQRMFLASFAKPADVTGSQFAEALAYAHELASAEPAAAPVAESAPVSEQPPPSEAQTDALAQLEFEIVGLPEAARVQCRAEIKRTFGESYEMDDAQLAAATKMAEGWPTGVAEEAAAGDAVTRTPPRRSAKLRGLIAYAAAKALGERELVALASYLAGSHEPRPLEELDNQQIAAITVLVDDVIAGQVIFKEASSGVLVVHETEPAS